MKGWIKLHRKIQKSEVWNNKDHRDIFLHLLLNVKHKQTQMQYNNYLLHLEPGETVISVRELSNLCKVSIRKIRTFNDNCYKYDIIHKVLKPVKVSFYRIINFNTYQNVIHGSDTETDTNSDTAFSSNKYLDFNTLSNYDDTEPTQKPTQIPTQHFSEKFTETTDITELTKKARFLKEDKEDKEIKRGEYPPKFLNNSSISNLYTELTNKQINTTLLNYFVKYNVTKETIIDYVEKFNYHTLNTFKIYERNQRNSTGTKIINEINSTAWNDDPFEY